MSLRKELKKGKLTLSQSQSDESAAAQDYQDEIAIVDDHPPFDEAMLKSPPVQLR